MRSSVAEFSPCFDCPVMSGIPSTGHRSGMTTSSRVRSHGRPCSLERHFAAWSRTRAAFDCFHDGRTTLSGVAETGTPESGMKPAHPGIPHWWRACGLRPGAGAGSVCFTPATSRHQAGAVIVHGPAPSAERPGVPRQAPRGLVSLDRETSASTELDERLQQERKFRWLDGFGNVVERALKGGSELACIDGSHVLPHGHDVLLLVRFHALRLPSVEPRNVQQRRPCGVFKSEVLAIGACEDVTHSTDLPTFSRGYWRTRRCSGHS